MNQYKTRQGGARQGSFIPDTRIWLNFPNLHPSTLSANFKSDKKRRKDKKLLPTEAEKRLVVVPSYLGTESFLFLSCFRAGGRTDGRTGVMWKMASRPATNEEIGCGKGRREYQSLSNAVAVVSSSSSFFCWWHDTTRDGMGWRRRIYEPSRWNNFSYRSVGLYCHYTHNI